MNDWLIFGIVMIFILIITVLAVGIYFLIKNKQVDNDKFVESDDSLSVDFSESPRNDYVEKTILNYLVVGGGGSGVTGTAGGGGGGGGVLKGSLSIDINNKTLNIVVGKGGTNTDGENSSIKGDGFNDIIALGGEKGNSRTGGSSGQGFAGGTGFSTITGGGGGGAGGTGSNGTVNSGGKGGDGIFDSITGFGSYYGGGGGGGGEWGGKEVSTVVNNAVSVTTVLGPSGGYGGSGIGGGGGGSDMALPSAIPYTGSGGGGNNYGDGIKGSSGIVVLRLSNDYYSGKYSGDVEVFDNTFDKILVYKGSGTYTIK